MKIEYKILWLDDNIKTFHEDDHINDIENHLIENGFIPIIHTANNSTDFFAMLDKDHEYDLILTDFHMSDMEGDKVVEKIRGQDYLIMTEILFYTARAELNDTDRISRISFLETSKKSGSGSHAEIVAEETKKLIDLTIKKFQHIVTMRGMIMHETSSLDERMLNVISNYIKSNKLDPEFRKQLVMPIGEFHERKLKHYNKSIEKDKIEDIISDSVIFGASQRASAIEKILLHHKLDNFINEYKEEVINLRNKFAHAKLMIAEGGEKYFENKTENIKFNSQLCKMIRSNIIKHDKHIKNIEDLFS